MLSTAEEREKKKENSVLEAHNLDDVNIKMQFVSPLTGFAGPPRKFSLNSRINSRAKQKARHRGGESLHSMAHITGTHLLSSRNVAASLKTWHSLSA